MNVDDEDLKKTSLPEAVLAGDLVAAKRLLDAGAPVDGKAGGYSPLMIAAGFGRVRSRWFNCSSAIERTENLLDSRMRASGLAQGRTRVSPEVARLLLDHGAFIGMQSPTLGHTPLHDAVWHKKLAMVKLLLSLDAKTTLKTHGGQTPLDFSWSTLTT